MRVAGAIGIVLGSLLAAAAPTVAQFCAGDCNGDGRVTVDELQHAVASLFDATQLASCANLDVDGSGSLSVAETLMPLSNAIDGCPSSPTACNGSEQFCERRYDEVAYVTTHNAMANSDDGFQGPNQAHSVSVQLRDGVRALMLDTHPFNDDVYLCHADCVLLGYRRLADTLGEIRAFLERRPREVVTIIFEAYVSAADTEAAFVESGLLQYTHVQPLGEAWPTLEEMIDSGKRLVVFSDNDRGARPWYHYVWDYAFETNFSFARPGDLSCTPNRGDPHSSLFILNHFLTRATGSINLARQVNFNPLFIDRALQCQAEDQRLPNFVTVDFYDLGDVFDVVSELNQPR